MPIKTSQPTPGATQPPSITPITDPPPVMKSNVSEPESPELIAASGRDERDNSNGGNPHVTLEQVHAIVEERISQLKPSLTPDEINTLVTERIGNGGALTAEEARALVVEVVTLEIDALRSTMIASLQVLLDGLAKK